MNSPKQKPRLIKAVKDRLLAKEGLMGQVADEVRTQQQTIKRQLVADSPQLCLPHYIKAIKTVLAIMEDEEITELYSVGEAHLVTE